MSEIITDKLTGKASAGNVTITDGSVTMTLNDSVAKVLSGFNQHASSTIYGLTNNQSSSENLNTASYTDVSTGRYEINFTNSFSNTQYIPSSSAVATNNLTCPEGSGSTTAKAAMRTTDADSNAAQDNMSYCSISGGLA